MIPNYYRKFLRNKTYLKVKNNPYPSLTRLFHISVNPIEIIYGLPGIQKTKIPEDPVLVPGAENFFQYVSLALKY